MGITQCLRNVLHLLSHRTCSNSKNQSSKPYFNHSIRRRKTFQVLPSLTSESKSHCTFKPETVAYKPQDLVQAWPPGSGNSQSYHGFMTFALLV